MFLDTVRGKNGGVEFWQIAVDKANSEEYFGESDERFLVVISLYLHETLLGKILVNCASFVKFAKIFTIQYFPTYVDYVSANTVRVVHSADIIKFGDLATNTTFSLMNWPGIDIRYYHSILLKIILAVTLAW